MRTGPSAPRVWLNPVAVWELLDQLDISQNQLARLAGISPGHLSLLMNGKRSPAPAVRRRLMKALGVDDFHVLFVMERPAAADSKPGRPAPPTQAATVLNVETIEQNASSHPKLIHPSQRLRGTPNAGREIRGPFRRLP